MNKNCPRNKDNDINKNHLLKYITEIENRFKFIRENLNAIIEVVGEGNVNFIPVIISRTNVVTNYNVRFTPHPTMQCVTIGRWGSATLKKRVRLLRESTYSL